MPAPDSLYTTEPKIWNRGFSWLYPGQQAMQQLRSVMTSADFILILVSG
jgi:hypothetical protein